MSMTSDFDSPDATKIMLAAKTAANLVSSSKGISAATTTDEDFGEFVSARAVALKTVSLCNDCIRKGTRVMMKELPYCTKFDQ
jgi:hypothetical protein